MEGSSLSSTRSSSSGKEKITETQGEYKINEPLTGKPWSGIFIRQSHLGPRYNLILPKEMYDILPEKDIPTVLMCEGKEWKMDYYGGGSNKVKRFNYQWKHFVEDNDLKINDACVFELMECTAKQLKFKVQILREDITPALRTRLYGNKTELRGAYK